MTEVSRQTIDRFFKNECTAEEAEQVVRYLEENPYLLEVYAEKQEWDEAGKELSLPAALREEMKQRVYETTRPPVRRIWLIRSAAAACIAGLLFLGYHWITPADHVTSQTASRTQTIASIPKPVEKLISNPGPGKMTFTTPDGSVIELAANSELAYQEPFTAHARDFRLKGAARFDVAKDPLRAFTVYAGGIATTALGTSFYVKAEDMASRVSVLLISGKVSVRQENAVAGVTQPPLYLSPGDEMIFNREQRSMALLTAHSKNMLAANPKKMAAPVRGSTTETPETWTFYNQPLPEILKTLQGAYPTQISWSQGLSKIRFTGTFNKSDSLSYILGTVGSISKLQVLKTDSSYRIEK